MMRPDIIDEELIPTNAGSWSKSEVRTGSTKRNRTGGAIHSDSVCRLPALRGGSRIRAEITIDIGRIEGSTIGFYCAISPENCLPKARSVTLAVRVGVHFTFVVEIVIHTQTDMSVRRLIKPNVPMPNPPNPNDYMCSEQARNPQEWKDKAIDDQMYVLVRKMADDASTAARTVSSCESLNFSGVLTLSSVTPGDEGGWVEP
jgi:hypothetical protein